MKQHKLTRQFVPEPRGSLSSPRDAAEKSNHKEHEDFSRRTRRSLFIYHSFFVLFAPFLRDLCGSIVLQRVFGHVPRAHAGAQLARSSECPALSAERFVMRSANGVEACCMPQVSTS